MDLLDDEESLNSGPPPGFNSKGIATIFLGNLSREITNETLAAYCGKIGKIVGIKVFKKQNGGVFGFVRFSCNFEAKEAIKRLNKTWILDRRIGVDWARYDLLTIKFGDVCSESYYKDKFVSNEKDIIVGEINEAIRNQLKSCVRVISRRFWELKEFSNRLSELGLSFKNFLRWGKYEIVIILKQEADWDKWDLLKLDIHEDIIKVEKIEDWDTYKRHAWIEIKGLIPVAWSHENFKRLVDKFGQLLIFPSISEGLKRIDKALVFIETEISSTISIEKFMKVGNNKYKIILNEIGLNDEWDYIKDDEFRYDIKRNQATSEDAEAENEGCKIPMESPVFEAISGIREEGEITPPFDLHSNSKKSHVDATTLPHPPLTFDCQSDAFHVLNSNSTLNYTSHVGSTSIPQQPSTFNCHSTLCVFEMDKERLSHKVQGYTLPVDAHVALFEPSNCVTECAPQQCNANFVGEPAFSPSTKHQSSSINFSSSSFPQVSVPVYAELSSDTETFQCCKGKEHEFCIRARKNVQEAKERKMKDKEKLKEKEHAGIKPSISKKKSTRKKSKQTFAHDFDLEDMSNEDVGSRLDNIKSLGKSIGLSFGGNLQKSKDGLTFAEFIKDLE